MDYARLAIRLILLATHRRRINEVFIRESLFHVRAIYGREAQPAWRDQLLPHHEPPDFDPDLPF